MSDETGAGPISSVAEVLEKALEGGLLRLVVSRPVQDAIGRLVYGATDVPTAYLEGWAQRVRNDNLAQKQITSALAAKAKSIAVADENLVQRGVDRWTRKLENRQKSIEDVAIRAIDVLSDEPLPAGAAAPSEDFMRAFEDMAERATTESIADLLARVLAGEIRKPSSVSRRTLQIVAAMDQDTVQALEYLRPRLFDPNWTIYPSGDAEFAQHADLTDSVSITRTSNLVSLKADERGDIFLVMGNKAIVAVSVPNNSFFVNTLTLTPIGREIFDLLPPSSQEKFQEIAFGLKLLRQIERVDICDLEHAASGFSYRNRRVLLGSEG